MHIMKYSKYKVASMHGNEYVEDTSEWKAQVVVIVREYVNT